MRSFTFLGNIKNDFSTADGARFYINNSAAKFVPADWLYSSLCACSDERFGGNWLCFFTARYKDPLHHQCKLWHIVGRFGNVLYVGLPDEEARQEILLIQKSRMPWDSDIDVSSLVTATEGYSAASIVALCRRAAIKAMQRLDSAPSESECINIRDFDLAFGEKTEK